jgi:hypothetical protein
LGIGDWGLGIGPNPQSPIPNPQSPIPNPHKKFIYNNKNCIFIIGQLNALNFSIYKFKKK